MADIKLHEGELNIMELLWSNKSLAAKDIAKIIKDYVGWEKNTTYTVIKRLVEKGAIKREDPGFICRAIISKRAIQFSETEILLDKLYSGSLIKFFVDYLGNQVLSSEEIGELQKIVNDYHNKNSKI
jgi:predicted transcriptional regulator